MLTAGTSASPLLPGPLSGRSPLCRPSGYAPRTQQIQHQPARKHMQYHTSLARMLVTQADETPRPRRSDRHRGERALGRCSPTAASSRRRRARHTPRRFSARRSRAAARRCSGARGSAGSRRHRRAGSRTSAPRTPSGAPAETAIRRARAVSSAPRRSSARAARRRTPRPCCGASRRARRRRRRAASRWSSSAQTSAPPG